MVSLDPWSIRHQDPWVYSQPLNPVLFLCIHSVPPSPRPALIQRLSGFLAVYLIQDLMVKLDKWSRCEFVQYLFQDVNLFNTFNACASAWEGLRGAWNKS